jgi:hypothetical protein
MTVPFTRALRRAGSEAKRAVDAAAKAFPA